MVPASFSSEPDSTAVDWAYRGKNNETLDAFLWRSRRRHRRGGDDDPCQIARRREWACQGVVVYRRLPDRPRVHSINPRRIDRTKALSRAVQRIARAA